MSHQIGYIGHREGCVIAATGQAVAFNEEIAVDDDALAVGLLAQYDNWVPRSVETATFLRDFCLWVEAVRNPPPLEAVEAEPAAEVEPLAAVAPAAPKAESARERKEREAQEAADLAAAAAATAGKDGE